MARRKTRFTGVFEVASTTRKYQGKADVAYDYCIKVEGKLVWKRAGWRSDGMTPQLASALRADAVRLSKQVVRANMTVGDAWTLYCRDWLASKSSYKTDRSLYLKHIEPVIGSRRMDEVKTVDINELLRRMGDLSPQTRVHAVGLVKRLYRRMAGWGVYHGPTPMDGVVVKRVDNARMRFLSPKEARWLLEELDCRSPQFADVCRVSLFAGLRLREIFSLKVQHVNIDARVIAVMDAKSGSRMASMTEDLARVLARYVVGRRPEEFVFTKASGEGMRTINQTFVRVVRDLELNDGVDDARHKVVFHTLRHTFASWLVQRGVPLYTVADLMGHSVVEMTRRYAKLAPDTRREAVNQLDGIL